MRTRTSPRTRVILAVILVSLAAWLLLLSRPDLLASHGHPQPAAGTGAAPESLHELPLVPALASLPSMATGWAIMIVAMMTPLLVAPLRHVLERSFKHRRARSITLFAVGHGAVWMAAGAALLSALLLLRHLALPPMVIVALVGAIALAWQCSPARQRCVNRSHHHPQLAAFGAAADRDALRFGATHGAWCVGACWALMLFPLALPQGHLAAMIVITLALISERLEAPRPPAWRLHVPTKLLRIALAQARMRLPSPPSHPRTSPSGGADD